VHAALALMLKLILLRRMHAALKLSLKLLMLLHSAVAVARDEAEAEAAAAEACSAVADAEIANEADVVDVVAEYDATAASMPTPRPRSLMMDADCASKSCRSC
jgi:hypothetical protein